MQLTIVGAGAIGGLLGAYLIAAGRDVVLVDANEAHVEAINRRGLQVHGIRGDLHVEARAYLPADAPAGREAVLLACKSLHTEEAVEGIAPKLAPNGFIASLQNGFNEERIAELVGAERTLGGLPDYGGAFLEPGVLEFTSEAPLYLGELDGRRSERVEALRDACSAFVDTRVSDNVLGQVWSKNIYLLQHKLGFTCIPGDEVDDGLYQDPGFHFAAVALVREGLEIARRHGIAIPGSVYFEPELYDPQVPLEQAGAHIVDMRARLMAGRRALIASGYQLRKRGGGLWWDIVHHRRASEAGLSGDALVAFGRQVGIAAVLVAHLTEQIRSMERGELERGRHNLRSILAVASAAGHQPQRVPFEPQA